MGDEQKAEIILYQSDGANVPVQVRYMDETLWMPQKEIAELFGTTKQTISYHMGNIFKEGELAKEAVVKEILTTASDGKNYRVGFYNLDAIIAVGYRVSSKRATKFRQWAIATLKEYITKGFVLNDDMLKNGAPFFSMSSLSTKPFVMYSFSVAIAHWRNFVARFELTR